MEAYLMTRGINHMRDQWVAQMQSKFFPWKRTNLKTGEEETLLIQGSLRPIELWCYAFPQECLQEVLTMTHTTNDHTPQWGQGLAKNQIALAGLRKMLGCKKAPEFPPLDLNKMYNRPVITPGFGANLIGIKEDITAEKEEWGVKQEML